MFLFGTTIAMAKLKSRTCKKGAQAIVTWKSLAQRVNSPGWNWSNPLREEFLSIVKHIPKVIGFGTFVFLWCKCKLWMWVRNSIFFSFFSLIYNNKYPFACYLIYDSKWLNLGSLFLQLGCGCVFQFNTFTLIACCVALAKKKKCRIYQRSGRFF